MKRREILHIIRNPYGHSDDEVRAARLAAADEIEHLEREALRYHDALSLVALALSQHSYGATLASMQIAGNGPTIGQVVERALTIKVGT